ncbi:18184_t:CDS:2, partial [Racocetra persica]
LKYGGWIEIVEGNPDFKNGGKIFKEFYKLSAATAFREKGVDPDIVNILPKFIEENEELTDFGYSRVDAPLGDWSGYLGFVMLKSVRKIFEDFVFMQDLMKISKEQYNELLDNFEKESNENKTILELYRFFARKGQIS